jgi:vancomycin permeability regulator SanA
MRLCRKRGLAWAARHIDSEAVNARDCYRLLMNKRINLDAARVGLVGAVLISVEPTFLGAWKEITA